MIRKIMAVYKFLFLVRLHQTKLGEWIILWGSAFSQSFFHHHASDMIFVLLIAMQKLAYYSWCKNAEIKKHKVFSSDSVMNGPGGMLLGEGMGLPVVGQPGWLIQVPTYLWAYPHLCHLIIWHAYAITGRGNSYRRRPGVLGLRAQQTINSRWSQWKPSFQCSRKTLPKVTVTALLILLTLNPAPKSPCLLASLLSLM